MNSLLTLHIPIGILSRNFHCYRLDTGLFTIQIIQHGGCKAMLLSPSSIHAEQHADPVAGFCTTGSGMQCDDGIVSIILFRKQCFNSEMFKTFLKICHGFLYFRNQGCIILFIAHLKKCFHIFPCCLQSMVFFNCVF